MNDVVLRLSHVHKTYRSPAGATTAVDDFSAEIRDGEFVAFVGPSGCGKTTLLKMIAGLLAPTAGEIDYLTTGHAVRTGDYGMAFQSPALLPWRSVWQNVMLPQQILGRDRQECADRARRLLELVRLGEFADRLPGELSGGMQQRVSLARSLLHDPAVLLMDEPFAALDAITRDELNLELQRIHMAERKTVLFVTHSIGEAVLLSDRIFVFSARPATCVAEITVELDRPRTLVDQMSEGFRAYEYEIRRLLGIGEQQPV